MSIVLGRNLREVHLYRDMVMMGSLLLIDIMSDRGPIPLFSIGENFQTHKIGNFAIFVKKLVKKESDNSNVRGIEIT